MALLYMVLNTLFDLYTFAIIAYIFMSWFPGARDSAFGQFLGNLTEPYLSPFRKVIPPIAMIDFSPIIAIFVLQIAQYGLYYAFQMLM